VRTGQFKRLPIAVNFVVRQFWAKSAGATTSSPSRCFGPSDKWVADFVVPEVIAPLATGIRAARD
jgi:hypothetical protein